MAWLKLDDNAPHHRKVLAAGDVGAWLWVCGLAYCQRHATDGRIAREAVPFLGCTGWKAGTPRLVAAGLWKETTDGYEVHDFLDWNDSAEVRTQKARDRNARVTRFRERTQRVAEGGRNAAPSPTPLPTPTPPTAESAVGAPANVGDVTGGPPPDARRPPRVPGGPPGLVQGPGPWGVQHAGHTDGVCGWKCMWPDQRAEFATGAGWTEAAVTAWAQRVRADFEASGRTPTGKPYDFWNARWEEQHGSSQPVRATSRAQLDPAAGVREALRRG